MLSRTAPLFDATRVWGEQDARLTSCPCLALLPGTMNASNEWR